MWGVDEEKQEKGEGAGRGLEENERREKISGKLDAEEEKEEEKEEDGALNAEHIHDVKVIKGAH